MSKKISKSNPTIIVGLLVFSGFITIFNEVEMNIALATVSEMYDVPVSVAQWLTTGYMLVAGTLMPLAAFVMSRFGSRNTVVGSLLALLVGVLISLFASSFTMLLVGRLIQAICAAFFMPVMFATIMAVAPREKIGTYNGMAMLALMAAPAISPTVSGIILSAFGFRWLFTLMLPFIAVALIGVLLFMGDALEHRQAKVDIPSIILSCFGFGGIVFGVGQAATSGFAAVEVIVPLVIGIIALVIYVRKQLASQHPLLNLRIMKNIRYRRSIIIVCALQLVLFGGILVLPLFIQRGWGLTAMEAGLYMLPGGILTAVGNLLAGIAYDKFKLKTVPFGLLVNALGYAIVVAAVAFSTNVFGDALLDRSTATILLIIGCALYSGALPFALTALTTNSLGSLKKSELPDGSSMNNTLNQIFGSLGTALYTLIVYKLFAVDAAASSAQAATTLSLGSMSALICSVLITLVALAGFFALRKTLE